MSRILRALGAISFLTAAAAVSMAPVEAAPAAKKANWNATVAQTKGGHVLGNPAAKTKLVEYMSYTCSHCAEFSRTGDGALKLLYIPTGKLSYEIRHLIRDPIDLTAALATNCGPASKFFANHEAIISRQGEWMTKARNATQAQKARWSFGTPGARFQAIAADLGFDDILVDRGYTRAEIAACVGDEAKARAIAEMSQADVEQYNLQGTPSFVLNGALLDGTHDWASLEAQLKTRF